MTSSNRVGLGGAHILSPEMRARVLQLKEQSVPLKDIAVRFGVSPSTISRIVRAAR